MCNWVWESNNCLTPGKSSAQCYFGIPLLDADRNCSGSLLRRKHNQCNTKLNLTERPNVLPRRLVKFVKTKQNKTKTLCHSVAIKGVGFKSNRERNNMYSLYRSSYSSEQTWHRISKFCWQFRTSDLFIRLKSSTISYSLTFYPTYSVPN